MQNRIKSAAPVMNIMAIPRAASIALNIMNLVSFLVSGNTFVYAGFIFSFSAGFGALRRLRLGV